MAENEEIVNAFGPPPPEISDDRVDDFLAHLKHTAEVREARKRTALGSAAVVLALVVGVTFSKSAVFNSNEAASSGGAVTTTTSTTAKSTQVTGAVTTTPSEEVTSTTIKTTDGTSNNHSASTTATTAKSQTTQPPTTTSGSNPTSTGKPMTYTGITAGETLAINSVIIQIFPQGFTPTRMDFYVDGVNHDNGETSAPWCFGDDNPGNSSCGYSTITNTHGSHVLEVRAYQSGTLVATLSIPFKY